nr:collagen alpha-1(XXV) chain-like [Drosophila takahashii]
MRKSLAFYCFFFVCFLIWHNCNGCDSEEFGKFQAEISGRLREIDAQNYRLSERLLKCESASKGDSGPVGPEGPTGPPGKDGLDGCDGKDGLQGIPALIEIFR